MTSILKNSWNSLFAWCSEAPARGSAAVYAVCRLAFSWLMLLPLGSTVSNSLDSWGPVLTTLGTSGGAIALEVWAQSGETIAMQVTPAVALGVAFGLLSLVPLCLVLSALANPDASSAREVMPQTALMLPNVLLLGLTTWAARAVLLLLAALTISLFAQAVDSVISEAARDATLLLLVLLGLAPQLYLGLLADVARLRIADRPERRLFQALSLAQRQLLAHKPGRLLTQQMCVWLIFTLPSVVAFGYPAAVGPALCATAWMLFGRVSWLSRLRTLNGLD